MRKMFSEKQIKAIAQETGKPLYQLSGYFFTDEADNYQYFIQAVISNELKDKYNTFGFSSGNSIEIISIEIDFENQSVKVGGNSKNLDSGLILLTDISSGEVVKQINL